MLPDSADRDPAKLRTGFEGGGTPCSRARSPEIGDDAGYPLLDKLWSLDFANGIVSRQAPLRGSGGSRRAAAT